jgi:indole-3-glycerol phosphate synthase
MATQLDQILARTAFGVAERKATADRSALERRAAAHQPRGFAANLQKISRSFSSDAKTRPAVIAELKKASPSKGIIRASFDPEALAKALEASGAGALSVLTDEEFFQGSLKNLEVASAATSIPCLRKDFMVDMFQVLEARASSADAILLIVAALTDAELKTLSSEAYSFGLDVLCEVHDREELERAVQIGCQMIGVNSRDLRTFVMHPEIQMELAEAIPANVVRVAESGIRGREDIDRLAKAGYDAFLIGETLMRENDPGTALRMLLGNEAAVVA